MELFRHLDCVLMLNWIVWNWTVYMSGSLQKLSKLDGPDMRDTAEEVKTNS